MRNTHLLADSTNSIKFSNCRWYFSAGIEPLPANIYTFNGAKGTFIRKNKELQKILIEKGEDKDKWWDQMLDRRWFSTRVTR